MLSGSVALLGDTLHNAADALTALPLGVAFVLGRRPPTRRYTYGYGRAEDLAGIAIVLTIAASSALAAYEAVTRLLHPHHVSDLIAVAAAALAGFAGNELAAWYRIRTGRKIGSAALVADGLHARTDGLTSLAVLLGAGGVALGWDWADPVVGLVITVAILAVLRQAAREIYRRLMDAVDPALVDQAENVLRARPGCWMSGRSGCAGSATRSAPNARSSSTRTSPPSQAHELTVSAEHALLHAIPRLSAALVHADPRVPRHRPAPRPGQPPGRPRPRARIILTWRAHPACQTAVSMHRAVGGETIHKAGLDAERYDAPETADVGTPYAAAHDLHLRGTLTCTSPCAPAATTPAAAPSCPGREPA